MKLNALDWVVIAAVTVALICLSMQLFSDADPVPTED